MTVYAVPFIHSGEEIFYDLHSHKDERIRPFIALREEIEQSGYSFRVTKECFIDRRQFASNRELLEFLKQIDRSTYDIYLTSAKKFLQSRQAKLFSPKGFAQTILRRILPTGKSEGF